MHNKMHKILVFRLYFLLDAVHVSDYISPTSVGTFISCTSHLVYAGTIRPAVVCLQTHNSRTLNNLTSCVVLCCYSYIVRTLYCRETSESRHQYSIDSDISCYVTLK